LLFVIELGADAILIVGSEQLLLLLPQGSEFLVAALEFSLADCRHLIEPGADDLPDALLLGLREFDPRGVGDDRVLDAFYPVDGCEHLPRCLSGQTKYS